MMTQRQLFLQNIAQTSDEPLLLEVETAEGIYMYTPQGQKVIDFISGIAVSSVGHRHPKVVEAVKNQVDKYMHLMVYGEMVQAPQVKLAQKLTDILPESLNAVFFVNSGSEANEGALKLAKRFTGRSEIFAFRNAYHGSSHGCLSLTGNTEYTRAFRPLLPDVNHLNYNNFEDIERISDKTACVVVEALQAEAGCVVPRPGFMQALRQKCNQTGTLLILDEVQTGFGRTGKMFGFQHAGIVPDVVTFAKGFGGGMPIGAFVASKQLMDSFKTSPVLGHISTFGGHPVSAAAALASIEVIENEKLVAAVEQKSRRIFSNLKHPRIKNIKGYGLMLAAEIDGDFEFLKAFIRKTLNNGLLTDWFLFNTGHFRIAPPLTITMEQIDEAIQIILQSLNEMEQK